MANEINKILHNDNNELIIEGVDNGFKWVYIIIWISLILAGILAFYLHFNSNIVFWLILIALISKYWYRLRIPANFGPVIISRKENLVYVNRKVFDLEQLLFLSFYESEGYTIIRLEARRKRILFPNEVRLLSNCTSFEEAVQVCREIRDFIDPTLKINHVRLVSGKSKDVGGGSRSIKFTQWEYIQ